MKLILVFVSFVAVVNCSDLFGGVFNDCGDNLQCVENNLIKQIDHVDNDATVPIIGNYLVLNKNNVVDTGRLAGDIVDRLVQFFGSHDLKIKVPNSFQGVRELISEARHSKLKKFLLPFVVLMILKKSIETPIFLGIVGILAFKGLGAGLISLVLSAATAFKTLLDNHSTSKFSYEVLPQLQSSGAHWTRGGVDRVGALDYPNLSGSGYHTIP